MTPLSTITPRARISRRAVSLRLFLLSLSYENTRAFFLSRTLAPICHPFSRSLSPPPLPRAQDPRARLSFPVAVRSIIVHSQTNDTAITTRRAGVTSVATLSDVFAFDRGRVACAPPVACCVTCILQQPAASRAGASALLLSSLPRAPSSPLRAHATPLHAPRRGVRALRNLGDLTFRAHDFALHPAEDVIVARRTRGRRGGSAR